MTELDRSQRRLLGSLTLMALKHLAGDTLTFDADKNLCPGWRVVRVGEIAVVEKPADDQVLKCIDCYRVVERSSRGAVFKLDPARLVYSLRWQHKAEPPDSIWELVQDRPPNWVNTANLTLLAAIPPRAPEVHMTAATKATSVQAIST